MNLDEAQKQQVAAWLDQGLKLSEVQAKLASEMDIHLTYMEVRFLVDDLRVTLKDPDPPKPAAADAAATGDEAEAGLSDETPLGSELNEELPPEEDTPLGTGQVSVTVDTLARPGMVVSGGVTFSDGKKATWYLDQMGRLGVAPEQQGYKPSPADVQSFQLGLQRELQKMGF